MATVSELEARIVAIETHLAKIPAGTVRFVPGENPTAWEEVTESLTDKQRATLRAAGLHSVRELREAALEEDGFLKLDGLGAAADAKLRAALEGYHA